MQFSLPFDEFSDFDIFFKKVSIQYLLGRPVYAATFAVYYTYLSKYTVTFMYPFKLKWFFSISEFKTYGSEESKELYTVGLEYYDSMLGIPTKKRNPSCNGMISSPLKTKMTNRVIKDKELVLSFQQFYINLLQRYLISKHGENASIERHHEVLVKLKEMREILIRKSLQF